MILGRGRSTDKLQGRDAAGVDDALDAGAQRLLHDKPGSLDIVAADFLGVSRPETIVGGGVEEESDALERRCKREGVAQVALAHGVARIEIRARARWTHQGPDVVPLGAQLTGDRRSEKAAGAGDEREGWRRRPQRVLVRCGRRDRPLPRPAFGGDRGLYRFAVIHRSSSKGRISLSRLRHMGWVEAKSTEV